MAGGSSSMETLRHSPNDRQTPAAGLPSPRCHQAGNNGRMSLLRGSSYMQTLRPYGGQRLSSELQARLSINKERKKSTGKIVKTINQIKTHTQQAIGPYEDLLTTVKKRKLKWCTTSHDHLPSQKNILQGTMRVGRRIGRQKKRWDDNRKERTKLKFANSQSAIYGEQSKMERVGCKVDSGTPAIRARYGKVK